MSFISPFLVQPIAEALEMDELHRPTAFTGSDERVDVRLFTLNFSLFIFLSRSPTNPTRLLITYTLVSDLSIASLVLLYSSAVSNLFNIRNTCLLFSNCVLFICKVFIFSGCLFNGSVLIRDRFYTVIVIVWIVNVPDTETYSAKLNN